MMGTCLVNIFINVYSHVKVGYSPVKNEGSLKRNINRKTSLMSFLRPLILSCNRKFQKLMMSV